MTIAGTNRQFITKTPYLQSRAFLKSKRLDLTILLIPVVLVFTLLIMFFAYQYNHIYARFDEIYSSLAEEVIVIDTNELKTDAEKVTIGQGTLSKITDGKRLYFSVEDFEKVKGIPGVKEVGNTDKSISLATDRNGYGLNLIYYQDQLNDEIKSQFKYKSGEFYIGFGFKSLSVPSKYSKDFNPENLNILAGQYPSDDTNEILVPDLFVQVYYHHKDYQNVIDQTITFDTVSLTDQYDMKKNEYKISGVYHLDTSNISDVIFPIYTPWSYMIVTAEQSNLEEYYQSLKSLYQTMTKSKTISRTTFFENFENFKKAYGSGYATMIITLDPGINQKEVAHELEKLFPQYLQLSQYSLKKGTIAKDFSRSLLRLINFASMVAILLGLVLNLLSRNFYRKHNSEILIYYSLGFSVKEVKRIVIYEHFIAFYTSFLVAYLFGIVLYLIYFRTALYLQSLSELLNPFVFLKLLYLVTLCCIVSIIINIRMLNEKELNEALLGR